MQKLVKVNKGGHRTKRNGLTPSILRQSLSTNNQFLKLGDFRIVHSHDLMQILLRAPNGFKSMLRTVSRVGHLRIWQNTENQKITFVVLAALNNRGNPALETFIRFARQSNN